MTAILHDAKVREEIKRRVGSLRLDSTRQWGKMTVDQMLWHVNSPLAEALGDYTATVKRPWLVKAILRFLVLRLPWPKGAPTRSDLVATSQHEFDVQREKLLEQIDRFAARGLGEKWPASGSFGNMSGREWSWLQAKHLDHHLRQFSS